MRANPFADVLAEPSAAPPRPVSLPDLGREEHILDRLADVLPRLGLVGEDRNAQLVYLALTSRVLKRPVSIVVKGPSAGGKSVTVKCVLDLFPLEAYYELTGMSDRSLIYSEEPMSHRMLVLFEAVALSSDFGSYIVRTLLSEGKLVYDTVDKHLKPKHFEKEGPTGLIVTTTRIRLHPENETRMLAILADDTPGQTTNVMHTLAADDLSPPDLEPWLGLQRWIAQAERSVSIPFAGRLADLIPPVAVRLRRDFATVLSLVRSHAILHQATRERDASGRILATVDDYAVVRDLVADLISEGVGATVSETVRETVRAIEELKASSVDVTYKALGERLGLDKSAAQRRALAAIDGGFVRNQEDRKGRPADLVLGDPLPEDLVVLPAPDALG